MTGETTNHSAGTEERALSKDTMAEAPRYLAARVESNQLDRADFLDELETLRRWVCREKRLHDDAPTTATPAVSRIRPCVVGDDDAVETVRLADAPAQPSLSPS
jgi:hypothetical protein